MPHEVYESFLVLVPLMLKAVDGRAFVTPKLQGDLEVVRRQVIEVLHSCGKTESVIIRASFFFDSQSLKSDARDSFKRGKSCYGYLPTKNAV